MKSFEITYRVCGKVSKCIWFAWTEDEALEKCKRNLPHVCGWKAINNEIDIIIAREV